MAEKPKGGLTGSQLEIMEIFWNRSPAEATAAEVWLDLQETRDRLLWRVSTSPRDAGEQGQKSRKSHPSVRRSSST